MMSDAESNGFVFTWRIVNFSFCYHSYILSPRFTNKSVYPMPWQLELQINPGDPDDIWCGLIKYGDKTSIVIDFEIEAIGPTGHVLGVYEEEDAIFNEANSKRGGVLVKRSQVMENVADARKDTLTVRCHIYGPESRVEKTLDCSAQTKIVVNHQSLRLLWTDARELRTLFETDAEKIHIVRGFIEFPDSTRYQIDFFKELDAVEIYIIGFRGFQRPQCVGCKISLIDVKGRKLTYIRDRFLFFRSGDWFHMPTFATVPRLRFYRSHFIKNGCMVVMCELFCSAGVESQVVSYRSSGRRLLADHWDDAVATGYTLHGDIRQLFSDKRLCDVQLRAGDEIVHAHKSILSARCPIFNSLFQQDMPVTEIVEIQDIDIDTLKALLDFIYSDAVDDINYMSAKKLLNVGDKYGVLGLKELCSSFFMSVISDENVLDIAAFADTFSHADLKSLSMDYIVDHSAYIFARPEWLGWVKNHTELAIGVFQKLSEQYLNTKNFID